MQRQACDAASMVARAHPVRYSFREYIAHEEVSNTRHEYLDGHIYAMAGGTPEHSALIFSVATHLSPQIQGTRCKGHMSDLRIRVGETGLATYPDLAIVCGAWERDAADQNTVLNPSVIVEVLSPTTENYDRGEKFEHYRKIRALKDYVLVAHDRREIEVRSRGEGDQWSSTIYRAGERAVISSLPAHLDITAIYEDAAEPKSP